MQQPRAKREPTRASRLTSVEMDATPSPPTTSSRDDVTSNSSRSQSKSAEGVPETLREAVTTFAQHATPQCIALGLTAQLAVRIPLTPDVIPQLSQQDVVVAACVASFWLFQEWFVHLSEDMDLSVALRTKTALRALQFEALDRGRLS